jgi:hypothetical protein
MTETRYATTWWTGLDDGRVRCDVCPRACALHDGQAGLCFVRIRAGDRIVLTTYGRSSGFCVDPIEKGVRPESHPSPALSGAVTVPLRAARCPRRDRLERLRQGDVLELDSANFLPLVLPQRQEKLAYCGR